MAETWRIRGERVGACICTAPCGCVTGLDPTKGHCGAIEVHRITSGNYGAVDLSGRMVAFVTESPGSMTSGNMKLAVYVEEDMTPEQVEAVTQIYTGKAGGLFGMLAALVSEVKGVKKVPIQLKDGHTPSFQIGTHVSGEAQPVIGADGTNPVAIRNPLFNFGGDLMVGRTSARFVDPDYGWDWQLSYADTSVLDLSP